MWAALALAVGITIAVDARLDGGGSGDDQVVSLPGGTGDLEPGSDTTAGGPAVVPGVGQVRLTGTVTAVHLEGAVLAPREIPTPLTIVSDRGFGNGGQLTGIIVDGKPSTAVWDGGRPFVLASGGALVLDPVRVDLVPEGMRLVLGGGNHVLTPGAYGLDTPVAVGSSGIATPRDGITFEATDTALFEARGDAGIVLGADAARHFEGPGLVQLDGALELTDATGTRAAASLRAEVAAFDLTFTPAGDGSWRVEGVVEEAVGG